MAATPPKKSSYEEGSLDQYLRDISAYPLINRDEERALGRRAAAGGQEAVDALVRSNLRFVVTVAKKYQNQGVSLSDLINEGNLGLIRAAGRFDAEQGVKFISYAVWWIRQAIFQAVADQGRIVRLPAGRACEMCRVSRRAYALEQRLGRAATMGEIADETSLTERVVALVRSIPRGHVSLDAPLTPGRDNALSEYLADEERDAADRGILEDARADAVAALLASLRPREARIVRLYFGFDGDSLTLEQIGALLGITRERVRQIKVRALSRLRAQQAGRPA